MRNKVTRILFALIVFFAVLYWPYQSMAEQRGVSMIRDGEGNPGNLYKESYALLIGVSDYTAGWPDLENIPSELQAVESVLKTQGFTVIKHLDSDSSQLETAFKDFIETYGFEPQNRLLIYYAGHGETRKDGRKGYLVPSDAPIPDQDELGFLQKALPMSQILAWARLIEAKHAIFLFDSCFSGTVFKSRALPQRAPHITKLTARPVRQFITAGSAGETVPARSVFTPAFVDGLKHNLADLDKDGYVTGTELGLYLQAKVPLHTNQTPQFGKIKDYELSLGDFVFTLGNDAGQQDSTVTKESGSVHLPKPDKPQFNVGDKVLALWKNDGCLYTATVLEVNNQQYLVHYTFADQAWLEVNQLLLRENSNEAKLAAKVYFTLESVESKWISGRIMDKKDDQYLVTVSDDTTCRIKRRQGWVSRDQIIVKN